MKLKRSIERYISSKAIGHEMFVCEDMRTDILTLARLLCEAGYPRRGTEEETQTMQQFAEKVQKVITHFDAVCILEAVTRKES